VSRATVKIGRAGSGDVFTVRPFRSPKTVSLPVAKVAEMHAYPVDTLEPFL
jgi:hypothetical protein